MQLSELETNKIRNDFPILTRKINGKPFVYFDNASTTQKPSSVINKIVNYYSFYNSNIHRAVYDIAEEATNAYELTRQKISKFINASSTQEIIFTRNATEAINLVAYSWQHILLANISKRKNCSIKIFKNWGNGKYKFK